MESEEIASIPDIKIVGLKEVERATEKGNKGSQNSIVPPYNYPQKPNANSFSNPYDNGGRRRADVRFAGDKIGEELGPDSTVWELYQEEAKEFDGEMVDGRNNNLDMMLLFAGLFSAVVTGFLIESKNLLEQDPAEASLVLLLHIAQSQQRLEEGLPRDTSPPITIPSFEVPIYARWINGLWFLSLGLSLCAALVAMIAKEWLTAFISSRPRSPRDHALLHQQRLETWRRWYTFHIIDFLPTILHFALLLFSAGLSIYLWTLDYAIAIMIIFVVGLTITFYIGTAIAAARSQFCPYVTQVSGYIRVFFSAIPCIHMSEVTLPGILETLHWLAENARDQATADCSFQALAGITYSPRCGDSGDNQLQLSMLTGSQFDYNAISNMLRILCERIAQILKHDNKQLSPSEGISVARYATTLPHLVKHLESNVIEPATQIRSAETPTQSALSALDHAWMENSNNRYLTGEAITVLMASEIQLTEIAASRYLSHVSAPDVVASPQQTNNLSNPPTQNYTIIDQVGFEADKIPLLDLRARFSRALFRAGIVLSLYANGYINIRGDALIHLLESISLGLSCSVLNPSTSLSTHQTQPSSAVPPSKLKCTLAGTGIQKYVPQSDIGDNDGLLVPLMRIACLTDFTDSPDLARAATYTLSVAIKVILHQWVNLSASSPGAPQDKRIDTARSILEGWPDIREIHTLHAGSLAQWNTHQLLRMIIIDNLCAGCRGAGMISVHALQLMYQFASLGTLGQSSSRTVVQGQFPLIYVHLLNLDARRDSTDSRVLKPLIQWLNIVENLSGKTIMHTINEQHNYAFHALLKIWAKVPGLHDELDCTVDRILKGQMGCDISLLGSSDISALIAIGTDIKYAPALAKLAAHLVVPFLEENPQPQDLERLCSDVNLPHVLLLTGAALNHLPSADPVHLTISKAFTYTATTLQRRIQASDVIEEVRLYDRSLFIMVSQVLQDQLASLPTTGELLSGYEDLVGALDDPDAWLYGPIVRLFEQRN